MTSAPDGPRPTKSQRTKAAILEAAREHFARDGYDRTTVRSIAADASVDPALVIRYFTSKEALSAAAVDVALPLPDLATVPRDELGARLTRHFLDRWEGRLGDDVLLILLRSAVSNEQVAERLRTVFTEQVAAAVGALVPRRQAGRRAGLVASQLLGLALTRHLLRLPGIADRPADGVVADIGPTIQRYLTQDLG